MEGGKQTPEQVLRQFATAIEGLDGAAIALRRASEEAPGARLLSEEAADVLTRVKEQRDAYKLGPANA